MQTQNQSLKVLLSNFLEDLKSSKCEGHSDKSCQAVGIISESDVPDEVGKLRLENQKIRESLNAKQDHLSKCLDVLEKNHLDIGNLSTHVENICCERDKCVKLLTDKNGEITKLKNDIVALQNTNPDIEDLRVEKERYRQENIKLKQVIEAYKSESVTKNAVIEENEDEKERLSDELGKYKRLSEQLQDDIDSSMEERSTQLEELKSDRQSLLKEKQQCMKEIVSLKGKLEELSPTINERRESCSANGNKPQYLVKHSDLKRLQEQNELLQQELEHERERQRKCYSEEKVLQLELSNEKLRDTLEIVTTENKANLEARDQLNDELKRVQNAMEECEKEIDRYKSHRSSANSKVVEVGVENSVAKNERQRQCSCNAPSGEKRQSQTEATKKLEDKIASLQHDLDQANLEIAEYEEENKSLRQKLDAFKNGIGDAEEEVSRLERCYKECEGRQKKMRQDFSDLATEKDETIKGLKNDIDRLIRQKAELVSNEKMLSDLQAEKARLEQENEVLHAKLDELENTLTEASTHTEEKALRLEERIELLEKQDEEKQRRLENCCHEMNKIQGTLNAEELQKENLDNDILNLKNINVAQAKEIDSLKNSIEDYKSLLVKCDCVDPDLDCKIEEIKKINKQLEGRIKNLEEELNDKQCVIVKLEECLDHSNIILGDCEEELKTIHQENERLKKDLEVLRNNLEEQANESETNSNDKNMLVKEIAQTKRRSEELERENVRLLSKNTDQKTIEERIARLQEEYNKLLQESKEKDAELERITKQFELLQEHFKQPNKSQEGLSKPRRISKEAKELLIDQRKGNYDELKCLQCKNDELKEEVEDLRRFVNKVVTDNNSLKLAITSLLNTVVNKIKIITNSKENLQSSTARDKVTTSGEDNEPSLPMTSKCDCMEVIKSKYDSTSDPMELCKPCEGACDKIMEEGKIETITDARQNKSNRQSESRRALSPQSSCCKEASRCCKESG